jgi:hypothetical protein
MAEEYREVKGKLGFFGVVWRILFYGWQVLMIIWFFSYSAEVAPLVESATDEWTRAGASLGIAMSWGLILFFWLAGSVVLGILVLVSRPARTLVPISRDVK